MSKYKISVITPFHNVDMKYFADCVAAMRRQTIGFENIQWVIVVHNCQPDYLPMLREMFASDSNVLLDELNNEKRTPSSPRNRGLELIEAPFVGLLDADDYYADDCFEQVLKNAEETDSDMVSVRREPILASDNVSKLVVKTLFNNTERRTVMHYGHWDTAKMFDGMWGMSTQYFYSTAMLCQHTLSFDENVPFAEDYLFVMHCIAHARRVCYLNHYIGYKYVINDGSLVQSPNKPAATLLQYAKGFKIIYDTMLRYGVDTSIIAVRHIALLSRFILHSKDMTLDIRKEIKEILAPYLLATQTPSSNKLHSASMNADYARFARGVILNPEKTQAIMTSLELDGLAVLHEILRANTNTDIGRRNDFQSITRLEAWQYRLPLTDYAFFKPMIDLQMHVGEDKILTEAATTIYLRTQDDALLPCTDQHLTPYHNALDSILCNHHNLLLAQSQPVEAHTIDDAVIDTLNSAILKAYFKHHYFENGTLTAQFASPLETYFAQSDADYKKLVLQALANKDMDQLVAFTCDDVVAFFRYIEQNRDLLLAEVKCSEKRLQQLRTVLANPDILATALWPNLQRTVALGAGEHYQALQEMKRYTGDLPHNHGYYFTEEAILGKAVADNSDHFRIITGNNFYELLPLATDSAPVFWTQVELGQPYQLIVTNRAGLYRYTTHHFICPQKVSLESIEFTIY